MTPATAEFSPLDEAAIQPILTPPISKTPASNTLTEIRKSHDITLPSPPSAATTIAQLSRSSNDAGTNLKDSPMVDTSALNLLTPSPTLAYSNPMLASPSPNTLKRKAPSDSPSLSSPIDQDGVQLNGDGSSRTERDEDKVISSTRDHEPDDGDEEEEGEEDDMDGSLSQSSASENEADQPPTTATITSASPPSAQPISFGTTTLTPATAVTHVYPLAPEAALSLSVGQYQQYASGAMASMALADGQKSTKRFSAPGSAKRQKTGQTKRRFYNSCHICKCAAVEEIEHVRCKCGVMFCSRARCCKRIGIPFEEFKSLLSAGKECVHCATGTNPTTLKLNQCPNSNCQSKKKKGTETRKYNIGVVHDDEIPMAAVPAKSVSHASDRAQSGPVASRRVSQVSTAHIPSSAPAILGTPTASTSSNRQPFARAQFSPNNENVPTLIAAAAVSGLPPAPPSYRNVPHIDPNSFHPSPYSYGTTNPNVLYSPLHQQPQSPYQPMTYTPTLPYNIHPIPTVPPSASGLQPMSYPPPYPMAQSQPIQPLSQPHPLSTQMTPLRPITLIPPQSQQQQQQPMVPQMSLQPSPSPQQSSSPPSSFHSSLPSPLDNPIGVMAPTRGISEGSNHSHPSKPSLSGIDYQIAQLQAQSEQLHQHQHNMRLQSIYQQQQQQQQQRLMQQQYFIQQQQQLLSQQHHPSQPMSPPGQYLPPSPMSHLGAPPPPQQMPNQYGFPPTPNFAPPSMASNNSLLSASPPPQPIPVLPPTSSAVTGPTAAKLHNFLAESQDSLNKALNSYVPNWSSEDVSRFFMNYLHLSSSICEQCVRMNLDGHRFLNLTQEELIQLFSFDPQRNSMEIDTIMSASQQLKQHYESMKHAVDHQQRRRSIVKSEPVNTAPMTTGTDTSTATSGVNGLASPSAPIPSVIPQFFDLLTTTANNTNPSPTPPPDAVLNTNPTASPPPVVA